MIRLSVFALLGALLLSGGCVSEINTVHATQAMGNLVSAATITNAELKEMSARMRAEGDAEAKVAGADNAYAKRLNALMGRHTSVNGTPLNYKVYLTTDVNANASADGSIRVYSGLMDLMNDDELLYVLGHEIGHVANGDTLDAMRTAYAAAAARSGISAVNSTAASLSQSFLGDLLETAINAQFSQKQERAADDYALVFLKNNGYNPQGAVTALRKLEALNSGGGGLLSSHPAPGDRATRIEKALQ